MLARSDVRDRIDWSYRAALGRPVTKVETDRATAFVKRAGELSNPAAAWESYARTLFRLNEFVYVE